ncbi:hypothetical protein FVE85_9564 [Porphyridium purpureum]|uniref:C2H2-type domain-containing protein n=1 Tax=Porphyridium purpureum TaxID=35688 RepID=A0A5J4YH90_PORPP|nr:hypothetical protein FVE85_9564 [Porphyridium purpureum]|eukprot:POR6771..scf234_47
MGDLTDRRLLVGQVHPDQRRLLVSSVPKLQSRIALLEARRYPSKQAVLSRLGRLLAALQATDNSSGADRAESAAAGLMPVPVPQAGAVAMEARPQGWQAETPEHAGPGSRVQLDVDAGPGAADLRRLNSCPAWQSLQMQVSRPPLVRLQSLKMQDTGRQSRRPPSMLLGSTWLQRKLLQWGLGMGPVQQGPVQCAVPVRIDVSDPRTRARCPVAECPAAFPAAEPLLLHMNQHASAARDAVDPSTWTSLGLWRWPCGKLALLRSLQTGSNAATMHLTRCTDDREACRLAAERLRHASEQVEVTPLEWDLRPGVHAPALLHAEQDAAPTPPAPLGDEDAADDAERIFAGLPVSTVHAYLDRILALRVHLWKRMAPALATHVALELAGLLAGVQEAETEEDQVRAIARLWAFPTLVLCLPGAQQPSRERVRFTTARLKQWRRESCPRCWRPCQS